jgi:hypothetical protein
MLQYFSDELDVACKEVQDVLKRIKTEQNQDLKDEVKKVFI